MRALSFDDIQLVPRYNNIASRKNVDTSVVFGNSSFNTKLAIPIFSSNMDTITGPKMARAMRDLGGMGFLHRFCSIEENVAMYESLMPNEPKEAVVSLGVNEDLDRFEALYKSAARYYCIDVAHGHSQEVGRMIEAIKEYDPRVFIVAGNVCTREGAEYLAAKGADAIKIGVGPGSVCSTRIKTGFGVPQFTAIQECSRVNVFKIADGGIRTPGDAVKAFAAGADAVMLGGMLSGTDETPGKKMQDTDCVVGELGVREFPVGKPYKIFRGMASREAADDFLGGLTDWKTAEGVEIRVEAKGPVANVVSDLVGGIRSGMTYCGANTISQIRERAEIIEVTPNGAAEGKPHGEGRL